MKRFHSLAFLLLFLSAGQSPRAGTTASDAVAAAINLEQIDAALRGFSPGMIGLDLNGDLCIDAAEYKTAASTFESFHTPLVVTLRRSSGLAGKGDWEKAPYLDPIAIVSLTESGPVTVEFSIISPGSPNQALLTPLTRKIETTLNAGVHVLRLSDYEPRLIPLMNVEPIGSYQLATTLHTASGDTNAIDGLGEPPTGDPDFDQFFWQRTSECRFQSPPYPTGWQTAATGEAKAWYATDLTIPLTAIAPDSGDAFHEDYPFLPHRVHSLHLEAAGASQATWTLPNILRDPANGAEAAAPYSSSIAAQFKRNRMLRLRAVIRSANPLLTEAKFSLRLTTSAGVLSEITPAQLLRRDGSPAAAGEAVTVELFAIPPQGDAEPRQIDFQFKLVGDPSTTDLIQVDLLNIEIDETLIANVATPENGLNLAAKQTLADDEKPWPPISIPYLDPQAPFLKIDPLDNTADCAQFPYTLADHAVFLDKTRPGSSGNGTWTILGIYNQWIESGPGFTVPGRSAVYHSGLLGISSSVGGSALSLTKHGEPRRAEFGNACIAASNGLTYNMFVDDQQQYFYAPWAPHILEHDGLYHMYVTEHARPVFGGAPLTRDGIFEWTTVTPGDPQTWAFTGRSVVKTNVLGMRDARDINVLFNGANYEATWVGFPDPPDPFWTNFDSANPSPASTDPEDIVPVIYYKEGGATPESLSEPEREERVLFNLRNPESGNTPSENESPTLLVDHPGGDSKDIYYLAVTKNGIFSPQQDDRAFLSLQTNPPRVLISELNRGDRSALLRGGDGTPHFDSPVDIAPVNGRASMTTMQADGGEVTRFPLFVLDGGTTPALVEIEATTNDRHAVAGLAAGDPFNPLRHPTSMVRAQTHRQDFREIADWYIADGGPLADNSSDGFLYHFTSDNLSHTTSGEAILSLKNPRGLTWDGTQLWFIDSDPPSFSGTSIYRYNPLVDTVQQLFVSPSLECIDLAATHAGVLSLLANGSNSFVYDSSAARQLAILPPGAKSLSIGAGGSLVIVTYPTEARLLQISEFQGELQLHEVSSPVTAAANGEPMTDAVQSIFIDSFYTELHYQGTQIYWGQRDENGKLGGFDRSHYIGWFPHYAAEFNYDINQSPAQWFISFTGRAQGFGYGIRKLNWTAPISPP